MTGRHEAPDAELTRIEADHIRAQARHLLETPGAEFGPGLRLVPTRWFYQAVEVLEEVARG